MMTPTMIIPHEFDQIAIQSEHLSIPIRASGEVFFYVHDCLYEDKYFADQDEDPQFITEVVVRDVAWLAVVLNDSDTMAATIPKGSYQLFVGSVLHEVVNKRTGDSEQEYRDEIHLFRTSKEAK